MHTLPALSKRQMRRRRDKEWLIDQFIPCVDCGAFNVGFMEWHHRDPAEKEANVIAVLTQKGRKAAKEEIEKCDCLCANCHRLRHYAGTSRMGDTGASSS